MPSFPKTLIIGLGGIGSEIVANIYKKFDESNPSGIDRETVAFLCFDTDENDIKLRQKSMPAEWVVKTSSDKNITVGSYINKIKKWSTAEEWFDTSSHILKRATLNRGAGQVRMASRLAMMAAIEDGKFEILRNTLTHMNKKGAQKDKGNNINVHIVSSVAGGTGAGTFLQMGYLVKSILINEFRFDAPSVTGYFMLADVICNDPASGMNDSQKENIRANTYASLKELSGFNSYVMNKQNITNIEFEFASQKSSSLKDRTYNIPTDYAPYDLCYLVDQLSTRNNQGLGLKENYYDQFSSYIYLNCFSQVGANTRSKEINNIKQLIEQGGKNMFCSFGVSRIIYPIEDLLQYLSIEKVSENLTTSWLKIDKLYYERLEEYRKKVLEGLVSEKPEMEVFYMDNIELLAKNATGRERIVFVNVYNSTQKFDKDGNFVSSKAAILLDQLEIYIEKMRDNNNTLAEIKANYYIPEEFPTENNQANDTTTINTCESVIVEFAKKADQFVENYKRECIKQSLFADAGERNFVTTESHRLNTYILEKENEMHPMAARYFLYNVRKELVSRYAKLADENKNTLNDIKAYYNTFDIKDDTGFNDEHVETALEAYMIKQGKSSKLMTKLFSKVTGNSEIKEFKENYQAKSKKQVERIYRYAFTKLKEEAFKGLIAQVNLMVEKYEKMFEKLFDVTQALHLSRENILRKHTETSDTSIQYVFADPEIKRKLYEEKIEKMADILFPANLSRLIYEGIFLDCEKMVSANRPVTNPDEDKTLFDFFEKDVIAHQQEQMRISLKQDLVEKNIIDAIRYEAQLLGKDEDERLKYYFNAAVTLADVQGPVDTESCRFVNAWGIHPDCLQPKCLTQNMINDLMGSEDVTVTHLTAAIRLPDPDCFSKYEIVRADAVFLLTLEQNYPKFITRKDSKYVSDFSGDYYKAYMAVLEKMIQFDNGTSPEKIISPHLDKRWHIPSYLPNINEDIKVGVSRVYAAFFLGLINGDIQLVDRDGKKIWRFFPAGNSAYKDVKDMDNQSIKPTLNDLAKNGLMINPAIVDSILSNHQGIVENVRESFTSKNVKDKKTALLNLPLIQSIKNHTYKDSGWTHPETLLTMFRFIANDSFLGVNESDFKSAIINEVIKTVLFIGGDTLASREVCREVLENMAHSPGAKGKKAEEQPDLKMIGNALKNLK
ncbi:MAG: hypothetical protein NT040_10570 [Bacteroidetes bacterium]|nr:hypothetical protein [Bacteroidota bacterium]